MSTVWFSAVEPPDLQHEVERVVRLLLPLAEPAPAARAMGLVKDHRAVAACEQVLSLRRVVR